MEEWWVWLIVGFCAAFLLCGGIWLLVRWLGKRRKFVTSHGVQVFTHSNHWSEYTTKAELENFFASYMLFLASQPIFSMEDMRRVLSGMKLTWESKPFRCKKEWLNGACDVEDSQVITVGWLPNLKETALAHEVMHSFKGIINHDIDGQHLDSEWDLVTEFRKQ